MQFLVLVCYVLQERCALYLSAGQKVRRPAFEGYWWLLCSRFDAVVVAVKRMTLPVSV